MLVHGTVILSGSKLGLSEAKRELRQDFQCYHYRDNAMLVRDVYDYELRGISHVATAFGLLVEDVRDSYEHEEPEPEVRTADTTFDVLAGKWYKTNQDEFPLLRVTRVWHEVIDNENQPLFDAELVNSDRMPIPVTLDLETLKSYKPKPASLDDFEDLDITPPAEFEPAPHEIPEPEEKKAATVVKGAKLDKALIAQQTVGNHIGTERVASAQLKKLPSGYGVEVEIVGPKTKLPKQVAGVPLFFR